MESIEQMKEKVHYVAVTGIIRNEGKYLICKRSLQEKAFPGKWCVPGGKIELKEFIATPKDTKDHWLNIFEKTLHREVLEETGLTIKNIGYCSSLAFLRLNGFSTIVVSLYAEYESGIVHLNHAELTEFAWVRAVHAKEYDLIENIHEQIVFVDTLFSQQTFK